MNKFKKIGARQESDVEQFPIVLDEKTNLMWDRREFESMNAAATEEHIAKLNKEKFGGFSDWRMPTREELLTIVDLTKYSPATDTDAFPKCHSDGWYRTSTPVASSPGYAWVVFFRYGSVCWNTQSYDAFVRAVRGGQ